MTSTNIYAQDGVHVKEGDSFSAYAGRICRESYENSPFVKVTDLSEGRFRGPRAMELQNLPEKCLMTAASDGVGTKVVLHSLAGSPNAAYDLVAMTQTDIARYGGLSLVLNNVLDVKNIGEEGSDTNRFFRQTIDTLAKVAKEEQLVLISGETAELGPCVGSEFPNSPAQFNWSATMLGVYHKSKMITGDTLQAGQAVMALGEDGFRSNGISTVRKAFAQRFGEGWGNFSEGGSKEEDALIAAKAAAAPSVLYGRFLSHLNGWDNPDFETEIKVHAIAHLTGGAIKSKFGEDLLFPRGLSAELNQLFVPPEIMRACALWREMTTVDCYDTWNGGQGALVVIDENDVEDFTLLAEDFKIETRWCGSIIQHPQPFIAIHSEYHGIKGPRYIEYGADGSKHLG